MSVADNVTIGQFATTTAPVAGDSFAGYQATASATVRFLATQVSAYVYSTTVALTNQTTATACSTGIVTAFLASSPAGFVTVSINGTSVKLPYYNT